MTLLNSEDLLVIPNLDQVVTSTSHKAALLTGSRVGADQATSEGSGGPADRVDTHSVSVEGLVSPVVVAELENADMAIGGSTGKKASALMRSPRDHVHGGSVQGEIEDLGPSATTGWGGRILRLFTPDENLAIVRGRGQDGAKLGVSLGNNCMVSQVAHTTELGHSPMRHTTRHPRGCSKTRQ